MKTRGIILALLEVLGAGRNRVGEYPGGFVAIHPLYGETKWFEKAGTGVETVYIFFSV